MRIVLIGAGSSQFGLGMLGDIFNSSLLEGCTVSLVDINETALSKVKATADAYIEEHKVPYAVEATVDRKEALRGADVVVISIEVGNRFALWDEDWTLPQQYGIRQIYGENGGPGGLFHALRITPPIIEICDDVAELCPDAWVFNYSNPMTAITTAVLRKYPDMKFIGMCHEIASLERYLPPMLDTPFENLNLRSGGLNHFSVLLSARYRDSGKDAYPDILARAPAFFEKEPGYSDIYAYAQSLGSDFETEGATWRVLPEGTVSKKPWADRGLFKVILETYNLLPITVDSHFGEYLGWAWEVADHRGIKDFYTHYRTRLAAKADFKIEKKRHERLVHILEGIIKDSGYEEPAVNIRNDSLIEDLPAWVAVEVPAKVSAKGLTGVALPDYPKGMAALLRNYCGVYDLTAEAILTGKKEYVIQALLANPVVDRLNGMVELVDLMIERQSQWLGYLT